jgi:ribosomal protein S18 acetylase RimI-like enzyme
VLTVRAARPEDAGEIVRINVHGWQRAYAGIVPDDVLAGMDIDGRADRFRTRLAEPGAFEVLVAVEGDATVGYVAAGPYRIGQRDDVLHREVGEVVAIYVDPPSWGTGAGRTLMDAALARLAARGFRSVRLWVLVDNRQARRFYERAGFTADGASARYPIGRADGTVVDLPEVRYARRLP